MCWATIRVMSSCCSSGLNLRTSSTIDAIKALSGDPALVGAETHIGYHIESNLIDVKPQASIVIANKNVGLEHPQVRMGIGANSVPVRSV
jgi:hypothetical protein